MLVKSNNPGVWIKKIAPPCEGGANYPNVTKISVELTDRFRVCSRFSADGKNRLIFCQFLPF